MNRLLFLALVITVSAQPRDWKITLFADPGQKGTSVELPILLGCQNVPPYLNDKTSSVNTQGHCAMLWEHANCKGKSKAVQPEGRGNDVFCLDHGDLRKEWCGMNDKVSSISKC